MIDPSERTELLRYLAAYRKNDRLAGDVATMIEYQAPEIARLMEVVRNVNARCDHLGMRLGEVIRERDAGRARIAELELENRTLRAAQKEGADCAAVTILAEYSGSGRRRRWASTGSWLYPGDKLVLLSNSKLHSAADIPTVGTPRESGTGDASSDPRATR